MDYSFILKIQHPKNKEFVFEVVSLKEKPNWMLTKYQDDLINLIQGVAEKTIFNKNGYSNKNITAFIWLIEKVLQDQYFTDCIVHFDSPLIDQSVVRRDIAGINEAIRFEIDEDTDSTRKAS
jgi:hypothetical protein